MPVNEWKELEIDNLPPDILTGDYEFRNESRRHNVNTSVLKILDCLMKKRSGDLGIVGYDYRRREKPVPTHKEIMTKWWNLLGSWCRVTETTYSEDLKMQRYQIHREWVNASYFIGRESADIPPEA